MRDADRARAEYDSRHTGPRENAGVGAKSDVPTLPRQSDGLEGFGRRPRRGTLGIGLERWLLFGAALDRDLRLDARLREARFELGSHDLRRLTGKGSAVDPDLGLIGNDIRRLAAAYDPDRERRWPELRMGSLEEDGRARLDRQDRLCEQNDGVSALGGLRAMTGATTRTDPGVDDSLVSIDYVEIRGLRCQDPIGSAIAQVSQHIGDAEAAEFLVRFAHDHDIPLQTTVFEDSLEGLEERGHPGLGVAGPTSEKRFALDHWIEGVDDHAIDGHGVEVARNQKRLRARRDVCFCNDARAAVLADQFRIHPEAIQLGRNVLGQRLLTHDLGWKIVAAHRIDRGNGDEVPEMSNAFREICHRVVLRPASLPAAGGPGQIVTRFALGIAPARREPMQRGALLMMLSALAFSVMTVLVKLVGERIPSQEIVVARAIVSLVLSWSLLRRAGLSPWGEDRLWLWIRGGLGFAGLSCVYGAVTHLPLAEATVLQYLHPPLTAIFAGLFLREAITRRVLVATSISMIGVVLVTRPTLLFGDGASDLDPFWVGVAVAGAAFSAAAYVVVRRLSRSEDALVIVFYFPLVTVPAGIPTMLPNFIWPEGSEWVFLLGIGLATQVGQVSLTRGLAVLPAAHGTALSYLQVVFAVVWGVLIFGEQPDIWTVVGGALVISSALGLARRRATGKTATLSGPTRLETVRVRRPSGVLRESDQERRRCRNGIA